MTTRWDIVIAGGGLSGLSMAVELAQPRFNHLRVLLVEPRTQYRRDRTWSFWSDGTHPHAHLERSAWARWRVAHADQSAVCGGSHTYRSIDADVFYANAQSRIAKASHIEVRTGATVASVAAGWPCGVTMSGGEVLEAGLLIDARPAPSATPTSVAQHFAGWEIECDVDLFDPSTVDLMDFLPARDGLHFVYVLPYGPRRALVETTWVSAPGLHHDYTAQLESYITRRWGAVNYRRVYEEQGSLALDPVPVAAHGGPVVKVGRAAGTLRPSTGFAFLETVAHCTRVANQIAECKFPLTGPASCAPLKAFRRKRVDRFMDAVFQRILAADWATAPSLFVDMFRRASPDRLIRFLSGQASWRDRAAVVASLPKWHCLQALVPSGTPQAATTKRPERAGSNA